MPDPIDIYAMAAKFRRDLLKHERAAAMELTEYYGGLWKHFKSDLKILQDAMRIAREAGEEISPAWLMRERRLQSLMEQAAERWKEYVELANGIIT